jgi:Ca2+:H+ antiporter
VPILLALASLRSYLLSGQGWPYLLTPFIPLAIVLYVADTAPVATFFTSAAGVIPTAALMGRATEELADRSGPGIGGLLNVTFGNAPELIIALVALGAGLDEVVKASLVGSVLGNILLVMGAAMFAGGLRHKRQRFNPTAASAQASTLLLAAMAFTLPAIYVLVHGGSLPAPGAEAFRFDKRVETLSYLVAAVLALTYVASLLFSLRTHRGLFNPPIEYDEDRRVPWSVRRSVALLALAGAAVAGMSEILVHSIEDAAHSVGLTEFFIGAVIVAIVGNAAEHWVAVLVAVKNKMDLSINIAIGSSSQIALLVVPLVILASSFIGPHPMPLVLNGFELAAIVLAVLIAIVVTHEGESTWFEGVVLLSTYVVVALAFGFA